MDNDDRNIRSTPRRKLAACIGVALAASVALASADAAPLPRHRARSELIQPAVVSRPAGTLVVTSCDDDGSAGTLRSQVTAAVSGDTVDLSALTCSTITLTQGVVSTSVDDLAIHGPSVPLTVDGGNADSVFAHYGSGTLAIDHMTIAHGYYAGTNYASGGCIYSYGSVSLDTVTLTDCSAGSGTSYGYGGAVWAFSNLTITSSTIANSTTTLVGGGAFAFGQLTLIDSTVSGNTVPGVGAGLFAVGGLVVHNSTIAFNTATYGGAGIYLSRPALIDAPQGTPAPDIRSSIVAANIALQSGFSPADIGSSYAVTISGDHDLIVASGPTVPPDTISADPMLLPLADNGGPTATHALAASSPAIDAGSNPDALPYDQRGAGFDRVIGSSADIGAYERQPTTDQIFANGFEAAML